MYVYFATKNDATTITCQLDLFVPKGSEPKAGLLGTSVVSTFHIDKPSVTKWTIHTGTVHYSSAQDAYGLYTGFGTGYPGGEYWQNATVTVPSPFSGGTCCFTQVYTPDHELYPNSATPTPQGNNNKIAGLDNTFMFDNYSWTPSATSVGTESDSPAIHIFQSGQTGYKVTADDSIQTWIMYMPPGQDAKWVPLQSYTWTWSATMTWSPPDNNWAVTSANPAPGGNEPMYKGTDTGTHPKWTVVQTNTK